MSRLAPLDLVMDALQQVLSGSGAPAGAFPFPDELLEFIGLSGVLRFVDLSAQPFEIAGHDPPQACLFDPAPYWS